MPWSMLYIDLLEFHEKWQVDRISLFNSLVTVGTRCVCFVASKACLVLEVVGNCDHPLTYNVKKEVEIMVYHGKCDLMYMNRIYCVLSNDGICPGSSK